MVFESMINFNTAKNKPVLLILIGIVYSSLSLIIASWVFPSNISLTALFFTVLACVPLFIKTIEQEEQLDIDTSPEKFRIKEHSKVIIYLTCLFIGFLISFTSWFMILPQEEVGHYYGTQLETFCKINQGSNYPACMQEYGLTGYAVNKKSMLNAILFNNIKVLIVCLIFSFLYGSGALYILTWNAMVLSVAIGYHAKELLHSNSLFSAVMISASSFLKHGLLEMIAYFIAGLAGGIISVAVIKHHYKSKKFRKVVQDSLWLVFVSFIMILFAGILEVYL